MTAADSGDSGGDSGDGGDAGGEADTSTDTGTPEVDGTADESASSDEQETGQETGQETPEVETPIVADDDDAPEPDAFATEHGIQERDNQGRVNRMPYPRVKKIAENTAIKALKEATGLDLGKGKGIADYVAAHKMGIGERDTKIGKYESRLKLVGQGEDVMLNHPERFLEILPTLNPRYAELLAAKAPVAASVASDMPEGDYDLPNGAGKTYSPKGLQSLIKWIRDDVKRDLTNENSKTLKPILDERASREYERTVLIPGLQQRVNHAIENWKGFKDWQPDVLAELDKNKNLSLEDAYLAVRDRKHEEEVAKLKTDKEKTRKEVLAEMKKAPKSTTVAGKGAGSSGTNDAPKTSADIIRGELRKKGLMK